MSRPTSRTPDERGRWLAIWTLRIILALVFFSEGLDKFSSSRLWATVFGRIGFGEWFRYATGAIEVAGAVLLLIPPVTTIAVILLTCTMVGAILTHIFVIGVGPATVLVSTLVGLLLTIGWSSHAAGRNSRDAAASHRRMFAAFRSGEGSRRSSEV